MSTDVDERKVFEVPAAGVFRVVIGGREHEYSVDEGDEIALEWERESA